jgi:mannitol-specific phosphotransferase system IIBC component
MKEDRKIITIAVIFTLMYIVSFSCTSQISLAKTSQDKTKTDSQSSSSQTKDKTKTDSQSSSSQTKSSTDNTSSDMDKMKFQQFGTCLGIAAGKDSFATEKEVKNCFLIVYDSEPSLSDASSSTSANK